MIMDTDIQEVIYESGHEQLPEDQVEFDQASCSSLLDTTTETDDEVSTKKEKHFRLGPENLDDTLVYDFGDGE